MGTTATTGPTSEASDTGARAVEEIALSVGAAGGLFRSHPRSTHLPKALVSLSEDLASSSVESVSKEALTKEPIAVSVTRTLGTSSSARPHMPGTGKLAGSLAALVHHVELSKAGWRQRALESMVLAICFSSAQPLTGEEILADLNDQLDAPVGRAQVESVLHLLLSKGRLVESPDGKYKLSEATWSEVETNFSSAEGLEETVRSSFEDRFSDIDEEQTPSWDAFKSDFVFPLISELGARTYEVVSSGRGTVTDASTHTQYLQQFPKELRADVADAISKFFDPSDPAVRRYVLNRLNATFLVQATGLTEKAFRALSDATTRQLRMKVFVDTNFLFSLIGLHENPADDVVEALESLLRMTGGQTDVKLYVLPITLDEARHTIGGKKDQLHGVVIGNRLARAVHSETSDFSGIALKYIREALSARTPLSADEYFEPYLENLVEICRSKGVELYNTDLGELRTHQDVIDDLLEETERQEAFRARGAKPYNVILHDMVLWHFASRERPEGVESPVEAGYWIATIDFGFLGFDRRKKERLGWALPITIHPTVLLQMLQFWVPQTEELEVALINSLQPLLPHEFDASAEAVTLKILRVLSRYEAVEDMGEEVLSNIFMDEAVRSRVGQTDDLDEQVAVIKSAIVDESRKLRQRAEGLEGEKDKLKTAIGRREEEIEELRSELQRVQKAQAEEKEELTSALREATEREASLESRIRDLETRETSREEARERQKWHRLFVAGVIVEVGVLAALGALVAAPWVVELLGLGLSIARGVSAAALTAVGLLIAEFAGTRLPHVRDSKLYQALKWLRVKLLAFLGAVVASVAGAYVYRSIGTK